jgi:hypothetical protein
MHDWLEWYVQQVEQQKEWATFRDRYLCPCCFMPTFTSRAYSGLQCRLSGSARFRYN